MFVLIWGTITSRLGGWIVCGVAVLALVTLLKIEHNWRLKAEANLVTAKMAAEISQQQILLYQERERIQAEAAKKRSKLNELKQKDDLDGLSDTYNNPDGGVRPLPANPGGKSKTPTVYRDSEGTEFTD